MSPNLVPDDIESHAAMMRAQLKVALGHYDPSYDDDREMVNRRLSRVWGRPRIQRMRAVAARFDRWAAAHMHGRDTLSTAPFAPSTPIGAVAWVEGRSICYDGLGRYWLHRNALCYAAAAEGFTAQAIRASDSQVWVVVSAAEALGEAVPPDTNSDEWLLVTRLERR